MGYELIEGKVQEAREFFEIKSYPGNFFDYIINTANYIDRYKFFLFKKKLGGKMSGFISYANNKRTIICINPDRPIGHQNFTLAHEIGHLFLHYGENKDDTMADINGNNKEDKEQEAHQFAAEFIYPEKYVHKDLAYIKKNELFLAKNTIKFADYLDELCHKYFISFKFALCRILFEYHWKYDIKQKVRSVYKQITPISKHYDPCFHTVNKEHAYYQEYIAPLDLMEQYTEKLINLEEISEETGKAIINRNLVLRGN